MRKGSHYSIEHRKHLSEVLKSNPRVISQIKTLHELQKGRPLSEEHRRRIGLGNKGKVFSDERRRKISQALKGKRKSEEHRRKLSEANLGKHPSMETRMKLSAIRKGHICYMKGRHHSEVVRKKISDANKGKKRANSTKVKMRARWKTPEYRQRVYMGWLKGRIARRELNLPNERERELYSILQQHFPNQWKYTGAGEVWIGDYNPDFLNINGEKKVIELFGDYWHRGQDPNIRIDSFKRYGFDCLVIWEHELKSGEVMEKIMEFCNSK